MGQDATDPLCMQLCCGVPSAVHQIVDQYHGPSSGMVHQVVIELADLPDQNVDTTVQLELFEARGVTGELHQQSTCTQNRRQALRSVGNLPNDAKNETLPLSSRAELNTLPYITYSYLHQQMCQTARRGSTQRATQRVTDLSSSVGRPD